MNGLRHPHARTDVGRVHILAGERDTCDLLCLDLPKAEALRLGLPPSDELESLALGAKALADPTRLAIALALRDGERACVCDLAWVVGRDEKLVSHHVRQLKTAGLAQSQRDGRMVLYELTARGIALVTAVGTRVTA
jgi:ArsR family transcriptional regulator, lead/cadmium/zinc/bismuth-responsive transcriptional repressor